MTLASYNLAVESAEVRFAALVPDFFAVEHFARHEVVLEDIYEVVFNAPQFFLNPPAPDRTATHVILGPNLAGRFLLIAVSQTDEREVWKVHTAHWFHAHLPRRSYRE